MRRLCRFTCFIALTGVCFFFSAALAQDAPVGAQTSNTPAASAEPAGDADFRLGEVVVTATKSEINRRELGSSITVITEKDLERRGKRMVVDALRDVPGLYVTQTGPFGSAGLYMRGSRSRDVMVLIDGVHVNDPSAIGSAFDFAHISADNVERIEVVRGAQGVLYGSSASGGVINIITRRGAGAPKITMRGEAGSFRTFRESVSATGGTEDARYSVSLERTDMRGFSSAAKAEGAASSPERDGYENTTVSSRTGFKVLGDSWVNCAVRYYDARTDMDDGAYIDDPDNKAYSRQFSGVVDFSQPLFRWWDHQVVLNYMNNERRYRDLADAIDTAKGNGWYTGTRRQAEWRNAIRIGDIDVVRFGGEISQERAESIYESDYGFGASTSTFGPEKVWTRAAYLQNHLRLFNAVFATAGVRYTDHETFGSHLDYQLSGSVIAPWTQTRLRAEFATGYQAPTLSELYDASYGTNNPDLDPQESRTLDVGVEQPFLGRAIVFELSLFRSKFKNMFGTDGSGKTVNKDRVTTEGMELAARIAPVPELSIEGSYTYLKKAEDESTGKRLTRNPKHQGSAYVNLFLFSRLNINCGIRYVSERDDSWYDNTSWSTKNVSLGDYYVASAGVSCNVLENVQVFARAENILGEEYEEPAGYETPRRSAYGGLKVVF